MKTTPKTMHLHAITTTVVFFFLLASALPSDVRPKPADVDVSPGPYQRSRVSIVPREDAVITPKIFIVSMFDPEAEAWWGIPEFDLLARNISVPGFSPLFPDAHCTANGDVCQLITGEGEINAAVTLTALYMSGLFDLTSTYFFVAGIAGINPEVATLGSVTFARYAVQVSLQYEFDYREVPQNWSTGYIPQGSHSPGEYPGTLYGTEVFELNAALRDRAMDLAANAVLADSDTAAAYRAHYANATANAATNEDNRRFAAAVAPPAVLACDTTTSDVYWSGALLGAAVAGYTAAVTNGSAVYCSTQQEDNASLEALLRGARAGRVDFERVLIMRTAADFDRPFVGQQPVRHLLDVDQGGFKPAVRNIYVAGVRVVQGIVDAWDAEFASGVEPANYVGDVLGSLGREPDFGPGSVFDGVRGKAGQGSLRRRRRGGTRSLSR